jgi:hypothetical protein
MSDLIASLTSHGADDPLEPWPKQPVYLSAALITILFGLVLIMALVSKTIYSV